MEGMDSKDITADKDITISKNDITINKDITTSKDVAINEKGILNNNINMSVDQWSDIKSESDPHSGIFGIDKNDDNDKKSSNGEPIILNIGGKKYYTSLITLLSDTNSILCKMFQGRFLLQPTKDGSYFIDRDGEHFKYVLNYLRTKQLNIPRNEYLINHLILEADYYNIKSLKGDLLNKKLNSQILKCGDIEFIQKSLNKSYPKHSQKKVENSSLIYQQNTFPDYNKIKELKCLLFFFKTQNNRFAFFIDDKYNNDKVPEGFILEFDSYFTGTRRTYEKYGPDGLNGIGNFSLGWTDNRVLCVDLQFLQNKEGSVHVYKCLTIQMEEDKSGCILCKSFWDFFLDPNHDDEQICCEELEEMEIFQL